MKRKQLILLHALLIIGLLFIFVFGPFYTNYLRESFEVDYEHPEKKIFTGLNFSSQQEHVLLDSTPLEFDSVVIVDFNSTQPVYVLVSQYSLLPMYEKSLYANGSQVLLYRILAADNYTITASAFGGTANVTVLLALSTAIRTRPYALWGEIMYYGGIALLIGSITFVVMAWVRKKQPLLKQPPKATSAAKKPGKK